MERLLHFLFSKPFEDNCKRAVPVAGIYANKQMPPMFILFLWKVVLGKSLVDIHGSVDEISTLRENVKDANFVEQASGSGMSVQHNGRKLSFAEKEQEKVLAALSVLNRFDSAYPDTLEIVAELKKLATESEYDQIKGGRLPFAVFFVDEESLAKVKTADAPLKVFLSTDKELARKLDVPFPGIYGYNPIEKTDYALKVKKDFIAQAQTITIPLLDVLDGNNMGVYDSAENPTFYILAAPRDHARIEGEFKEVARKLRNEVHLCRMAYEGSRSNIKALGLTEQDLPAIFIVVDEVKYREPNVTPAKAEKFVAEFLGGSLKRYALSGVEPADNDIRAVKVIVNSSSDKWLGDKTRDKLVVFEAPWCRFCKELKPTIETLGEMVRKYAMSKVMVGTCDMTENEMPTFKVNGYPTIYLVKAKTNDAILFEGGERSLKRLIQFLKTDGGHKVDLEALMSKTEKTEL